MSDQETNSVINTIKMQNAQANNIVPVVDTTDESLLPPPAKKPKADKRPGPPAPPDRKKPHKKPHKKPKAGERPEPPPAPPSNN